MGESNYVLRGDAVPAETPYHGPEFTNFDNIPAFADAVEVATGIAFDFEAVATLNTNFIQSSEKYLLLNVKGYNGEDSNNFLFLTKDMSFMLTKRLPSHEAVTAFADILSKPFGKSTVLTFLLLDQIMESYKRRLETLVNVMKKLEDKFDHDAYRNLVLEFERFNDRLEEFHDFLLRLQERRYKEVETQYIPFDYGVLLAESLSLQGRCRRRLNTLKEIRQEHEMEATEELNLRIVKLNDVVKRLTALTVILMLPTLIASHFGMNFAFMPELRVTWAYPAVIIFQVVFMAIGFLIFRKISWL